MEVGGVSGRIAQMNVLSPPIMPPTVTLLSATFTHTEYRNGHRHRHTHTHKRQPIHPLCLPCFSTFLIDKLTGFTLCQRGLSPRSNEQEQATNYYVDEGLQIVIMAIKYSSPIKLGSRKVCFSC